MILPNGLPVDFHSLLPPWANERESSKTDSGRALATEARQLRQTLLARHRSLKLADCAGWVGVVSRYSLVTGQEWHTWVEGGLAKQHCTAAV